MSDFDEDMLNPKKLHLEKKKAVSNFAYYFVDIKNDCIFLVTFMLLLYLLLLLYYSCLSPTIVAHIFILF